MLYDSERSDEGGGVINSISNYIHEDNEELVQFYYLLNLIC
ncbi:hypothetical protein CCA_00637 [Chlamydia caviae GPIC]|uniref:Uncharacterized protein n=1 Tax=Chlamydia caviae (strain ATCC VR-813 / DSM 19441 / 03DC25 / GPIC) TaxID=227941 RepID=Q822P2_CHLCV|nr:hypothetical protein CCA_00637 [Chlamydia caviae GPIC]